MINNSQLYSVQPMVWFSKSYSTSLFWSTKSEIRNEKKLVNSDVCISQKGTLFSFRTWGEGERIPFMYLFEWLKVLLQMSFPLLRRSLEWINMVVLHIDGIVLPTFIFYYLSLILVHDWQNGEKHKNRSKDNASVLVNSKIRYSNKLAFTQVSRLRIFPIWIKQIAAAEFQNQKRCK